MEINLLSSFFLFVTPLFLLLIVRNYFTSNKNLPPGPPSLPFIGNGHQMVKDPHIAAANFAKQYGPLISIRLGTQLLVIASTPEAAEEVLKTKDRQLSGRRIPDTLNHSFKDYYFIWANECNNNWKSYRTLTKNELFSPKAIERQSNLRGEKLTVLLNYLKSTEGQVVQIEELVHTTVTNTLSNMLFSKDFFDLKDEKAAHKLKFGLLKLLENSITPNVSDLFPIVGGLDLQGLRKDSLNRVDGLAAFFGVVIKERRAQLASSKASNEEREKDFLDRLLEHNFDDAQMYTLIIELFVAGTDTVVTTVEWALAELTKNKDIWKKVQEELKREIGSTPIMTFDFSKLTYFTAFIYEILRLHTIVPVLIPRRAVETCDVMSYTVPENTQIWVNAWAICHDPNVWEDPFSFKPERFLESDVGFYGRDFEFIPFGGGRRICPGLPSGIRSLNTILASLILGFDWALPNGMDPAKLDMTEKFGVTLQKETPLMLVFKHRE